jgi:hypothetical protein
MAKVGKPRWLFFHQERLELFGIDRAEVLLLDLP